MTSERDYQLRPIVQESVIHNSRSLSNLHSLTASLFGVTAGVLGLESYTGFLLWLLLSTTITILFYIFRVAPQSIAEGRPALDTGRYFRGPIEFWTSGLSSGVSGFVLTWTLFYGLVRA